MKRNGPAMCWPGRAIFVFGQSTPLHNACEARAESRIVRHRSESSPSSASDRNASSSDVVSTGAGAATRRLGVADSVAGVSTEPVAVIPEELGAATNVSTRATVVDDTVSTVAPTSTEADVAVTAAAELGAAVAA